MPHVSTAWRGVHHRPGGFSQAGRPADALARGDIEDAGDLRAEGVAVAGWETLCR
ncbi:MAG: hypothetical protein M5R42_16840 [Rhodocyclaceae bacterium]|nr:hypothetical protein [Rhodocyclaceae bacterium]